MTEQSLGKSLRFWFTVHFAADTAVGVPLFFAPRLFLGLLGWDAVDPVSARLVASALFGIGIASLLARKAPLKSFKEMLNLKIIWSAAACTGFIISLAEGSQGSTPAIYGFLAIFAAFNVLWVILRLKLSDLEKKESSRFLSCTEKDE